MRNESTSLFFRAGGSDKVYQTQLVEKDGGWVVNFQYGRRGSTLTSGSKTTKPISYEAAKAVYDVLVQSKTSKGYTAGEDGAPFAGTEQAGRVSGLVPQLLNAVDEDLANRLINDDDWIMQEKMDGTRLMNKRGAGAVTGSNRKGLVVAMSTVIEAGLLAPACESFVVDGEAIGDVYWAFDLLEAEGADCRGAGALARWFQLKSLLGGSEEETGAVRVVETYVTAGEKRKAFECLRAAKAEGVVFKRKDSSSAPGRPNSGGDQVKFKFKEAATCVVLACNDGKRSVQIGLMTSNDDMCSEHRNVGNVTIPANFDIPSPGSLIEVEYLYAFPEGSLYQPVYKGLRADKERADWDGTQKFKQGTTDEEEG